MQSDVHEPPKSGGSGTPITPFPNTPRRAEQAPAAPPGQTQLQALLTRREVGRIFTSPEQPSPKHELLRAHPCSELNPALSSALLCAQPCSKLIPAPNPACSEAPAPPVPPGPGLEPGARLRARCRSAPRCIFHARHIRSARHIPIVLQLGHKQAAGHGSQPPALHGGGCRRANRGLVAAPSLRGEACGRARHRLARRAGKKPLRSPLNAARPCWRHCTGSCGWSCCRGGAEILPGSSRGQARRCGGMGRTGGGSGTQPHAGGTGMKWGRMESSWIRHAWVVHTRTER